MVNQLGREQTQFQGEMTGAANNNIFTAHENVKICLLFFWLNKNNKNNYFFRKKSKE